MAASAEVDAAVHQRRRRVHAFSEPGLVQAALTRNRATSASWSFTALAGSSRSFATMRLVQPLAAAVTEDTRLEVGKPVVSVLGLLQQSQGSSQIAAHLLFCLGGGPFGGFDQGNLVRKVRGYAASFSLRVSSGTPVAGLLGLPADLLPLKIASSWTTDR